MSRLIVKNLPKLITEEKLRELFNKNGTITDVQLKYTKEGTFRRFGFIGFQYEHEAEEAIKSLHNTFVNTSKISVENCALLGDESKPKAWSKYASDSSAFKKANKPKEQTSVTKKPIKEKKKKKNDQELEEILEKYKNDPMFEEFLEVHGKVDALQKLKEKHLKAQEADDDGDSGTHSDKDVEVDANTERLSEEPISDLEYMKLLMKGVSSAEAEAVRKPRQKMEKKPKEKVTLFNIKLKDLPYTIKKKDIKEFFRPNMPFSIRIPRNIHGIAFVGYKTEKGFKKALTKDKSFIKGKQILVTPYEVKAAKESKQDDPKRSKWKSQEDNLKNEEDIAESGRIFIRNLAYTTTEKDVEELFSKYGPIAEINLPIDTTSRKSKGFGIVTFVMPEHAIKAYSELDGSILHGRMMHLLPGKAKDGQGEDLEESSNFKQKKAAKQKSQAANSHNWNSLFLGHDAVAEVLADTYNIVKEDVVGPEGAGSAAVRLAIGETQIVAETRKYLEDQGVVIDAFNTEPKKRSKTVILVKNLPSKTESRELREIFQEHGEIGRLILPPSGITAIVEFIEPSEARKAFIRLAYSKFKNSPLYLEWAPENGLSESKPGVKKDEYVKEETSNSGSNADEEKQETQECVVESDEEQEEPEPDTTLFVKNLNFQTTDEGLKKHFESCGKMKYATVATKKDKNTTGGKLSMGYGFVQFYYKASADKALKTLQMSVLDGKSLELKRSERALRDEPTKTRKATKLMKQTGSKILVRNVPFQANKKEIFELFSTFGVLRALRLPKKMNAETGTHRGFAFVDYGNPTDAKNAFEALSQSTHLYGRRLVLEWASTEETVDDIRKRTADHFGSKSEVKKISKSVFNVD